MDWELYAWFKRGSRRREVLQLLAKSSEPMTANEIKSELKIALSQASFTLRELSNKKLVECLNPKDKIGKIYKSSDTGKGLLNESQ